MIKKRRMMKSRTYLLICCLLLISLSFNAQSYSQVDVLPILKNCLDSEDKESCTKNEFLKFIYTNLRYPSLARENNIQGRVVLEYQIDTLGRIASTKILSGLGGGIDKGLLNVLKYLSNTLEFEPAIKESKKVNYKGIVPIKFKLDGQKRKNRIVIHYLEGSNAELIDLSLADKHFYLDDTLLENKKLINRNLDEVFISSKIVENDTIRFDLISYAKAAEIGLKPYKSTGISPRFPGCEDENESISEIESCSKEKMLQYIYSNLKYPKEGRKAKIGGTVIIKFVVTIEGRIRDITIVQGLWGGFDEECISVISSMNQMNDAWIPGKEKGKDVEVEYMMPIKFRLE